MAEETEDSKIAAKDIHPVIAVEAGYNLYLADNCEDPELRNSARISAKNFNKMMNSFPEKSVEGLYCLNLRMAANSLARGIQTRKYSLNKKMAAAEQMRKDMIKRIAEAEKFIGFLRGGLHLLLLGGFGYFLVRAIFKGQTQAFGIDPKYASIAFALALALIGACVKSRIMAKKVQNAFSEYTKAITNANVQYAQSVVVEYKLTAETAKLAWKELTGHEPPMTSGFHRLLISVMGTETKAGETQNAKKPLVKKTT